MADIPHTPSYRIDYPWKRRDSIWKKETALSRINLETRRLSFTAREIEAFIIGYLAGGALVYGAMQTFSFFWR